MSKQRLFITIWMLKVATDHFLITMSIHARDFALTEWVLGCVRDLWSFKAHQISLEGQGLALKTGIQ